MRSRNQGRGPVSLLVVVGTRILSGLGVPARTVLIRVGRPLVGSRQNLVGQRRVRVIFDLRRCRHLRCRLVIRRWGSRLCPVGLVGMCRPVGALGLAVVAGLLVVGLGVFG